MTIFIPFKKIGQKYKRFFYHVCLLGLGWVVLFEGITRSTHLALNQSDSLPQKAFLILKGKDLKRGQYVSFKNAWFKAPLIKEVIGVAGDKIIHDEKGQIWIARKVGNPLSHSKDGKPLHSIPSGVIPLGYVFVYAPHPRSFDSRYLEVGLVPLDPTSDPGRDQILGQAVPLF